MITTADFAKGTRILHNGDPLVILDVTTHSPSARGASTLVKFKARNLLTGKFLTESVKSGTKFEQPDIEYTSVQFLYQESEAAVFMNQANYEQFSLPIEGLSDQLPYLNDELEIKALVYNGNPVSIEIAPHVSLKVVTVEPGTKGNTASSTVTTKAILSNEMECQVPLNIKEGDQILVDTSNHSFYKRA